MIFGEIPLVTIGDTAFPLFSWLLKAFPDTRDPKKRFFNTRLYMLYKKCEAKLHNVKYVIMVCVLLHNLCISRNDPCNPRWKLHVDDVDDVGDVGDVKMPKKA